MTSYQTKLLSWIQREAPSTSAKMSVFEFFLSLLVLSAVCTVQVLCNTTTLTEDLDKGLSNERCSFVHVSTYTKQVEKTLTSSNISSAWTKLQGLTTSWFIGTFSRTIQNVQWDFQIQLDKFGIDMFTYGKVLEQDDPLNKIRMKFNADIGSPTEISSYFKDLDRVNGEFTGTLYAGSLWNLYTGEGVQKNMSEILLVNVTVELVYTNAVKFESSDCQNNNSVLIRFDESNNTSQGVNLPLPINSRNEKIRTIYVWTMQKPRISASDFDGFFDGFFIGNQHDYSADRWEVKLKYNNDSYWSRSEVVLVINEYSSGQLIILESFNVNVALVWDGISRKMQTCHSCYYNSRSLSYELEVSDENLKRWNDSLTVVMTFESKVLPHY